MKKALLIIAMMALTGCATMETNKINTWAQGAKASAQAGNMKWSDYYTELYNRINALQYPVQGKGFYLQASATMIDISKAYESGKISKDEFDSAQRQMIAKEAEYQEQAQANNAARAQAAYSQFLYNQAQQAKAWQARPSVNCTSYQMGNNVNTTCQ